MSVAEPFAELELQSRLSGQSKLFVVEPDKADVSAPRKRILRPPHAWSYEPGVLKTTWLGHSKSELSIGEWDFYTALVKTELAYALTEDTLHTRAYGAYLQHRALLRWNADNLRIAQAGVFSRKDSARTALSGRFGEALMYLYMVHAGYPYWDHLPSLAERLMEGVGFSREDKLRVARVLSRPKRADNKQVREPDFAFETIEGHSALAEAKGAFVNPDEQATMIKSGLAGGLEQLETWQKHLAPTPRSCFAIGAYLREENDRHGDPSILAVVDPESDGQAIPTLEFPRDWIRRGNYAAWMRGMGLLRAAELLSYGRNAELSPRRISTIEIGSRSFAVCPIRYLPSRRMRAFLIDAAMDYFHPFLRAWDVQVRGIEVTNLRFIERAVNGPDVTLSNEMLVEPIAAARLPEWLSGSILPDGTLNAVLHFDNGQVPLGIEEFKL